MPLVRCHDAYAGWSAVYVVDVDAAQRETGADSMVGVVAATDDRTTLPVANAASSYTPARHAVVFGLAGRRRPDVPCLYPRRRRRG